MRNWLIRTKNNKILGPLSKEKVVDLYNAGDLKDLDEVCSGNGYWFWIKEEDLVKKYLLDDNHQSFNPVSEAKTVLCNKSESGSVLGQSVESSTDDTKVIKNPFDKKKSKLKENQDDDFEYPDEDFIEQVKTSVEKEVQSIKKSEKPLYEEKRSLKIEPKENETSIDISVELDNEDVEDSEDVVLPSNNDLDYPVDNIPKKKVIHKNSENKRKKKKKKKKKGRVTKTEHNRNDVLLLSVIALILFAIIFIFYTQYSKVFANKTLDTLNVLIQNANASESLKKKTRFGEVSLNHSLLGISTEFKDQLGLSNECVTLDNPLDRIYLNLYDKRKPKGKITNRTRICKKSEFSIELNEQEKLNRKKIKKLIEQTKNKYKKNIINHKFSNDSKENMNSYYYQLRYIDYLLKKNLTSKALRSLNDLIKINPVFLSVELSLIENKEEKMIIKNDILKIIKTVVENKKLPIKERYIFLLALNKLDDRDLKRLLIDFRSRNSSSQYEFSKLSYRYFLRYLVTWLDSDYFNFNRIEMSRKYLESPQSELMNYLDLLLLKYYYNTDSLSENKMRAISTIDIEKIEFFYLFPLLESSQNLRFKQELEKYNPTFSKPLYLLKKNFYESRLYTDFHGPYMMIELLNIGAYDTKNLWWLYEL